MSNEIARPDNDMLILSRMTQALHEKGLKAELEHTGGGIYCIQTPTNEGGWLMWGVAEEVWGCDIYENEEYIDSHSLNDVPVSLSNIPQAANAIIAFTKTRWL
ncbi:MAG TPA: hypothetical protein VFZ44_01440 [Pyrinomonadaceae bacterium]